MRSELKLGDRHPAFAGTAVVRRSSQPGEYVIEGWGGA